VHEDQVKKTLFVLEKEEEEGEKREKEEKNKINSKKGQSETVSFNVFALSTIFERKTTRFFDKQLSETGDITNENSSIIILLCCFVTLVLLGEIHQIVLSRAIYFILQISHKKMHRMICEIGIMVFAILMFRI
jgi:hypothetical protein